VYLPPDIFPYFATVELENDNNKCWVVRFIKKKILKISNNYLLTRREEVISLANYTSFESQMQLMNLMMYQNQPLV